MSAGSWEQWILGANTETQDNPGGEKKKKKGKERKEEKEGEKK